MKKIVVLALALLMLCAAAMPAFAATGAETDPIAIPKGSPNVDGILDEMYRSSFYVDTDTKHFYANAEELGAPADTISAREYVLWDDSYVYVCAVVQDSDIYTRGEEYCLLEENPWLNDAVEFWFKIDGQDVKASCDAYGYKVWGDSGFDLFFDPEEVKCYTNVDKANGTYTVEMALPVPDLEAGHTFAVSLQVNSIDSETGDLGCAYAYQNVDGVRFYLACSDTEAQGGKSSGETTERSEVKDPDDTTKAASDDTAAPADDTTAAAGDETTAKNADTTKAGASTEKKTEEKKGCGSVVAMTSLVVLATLVAVPATISKKRK